MMDDLAYHPRQSPPRGPPIPGFKQALSPLLRFVFNNPIYTGAWAERREGGREGRGREGDILPPLLDLDGTRKRGVVALLDLRTCT